MTEQVSEIANLQELLVENRIAECTGIFGLHQKNPEYLEKIKQFTGLIQSQNRIESAVTAYVAYLTKQPHYLDGHIQLGFLLKEIGENDHAVFAFDNALKLSPESLESVLFKVQAFLQMGRREQAMLAISEASYHKTCNPKTLYQLFRLNNSLVSTEDALKHVIRILELTSCRSAELSNHLGNLYFRINDFSSSERHYSEALSMDGMCVDARTNLDLVHTLTSGKPLPLFLVLPRGENYGWGVCSSYLRVELKKKIDVFSLEYDDWFENGNKYIPGVVFTSIGAESLDLIYPVKGKVNIGYTFFERDLTEQARQNAAFFDLVLAGSSWAVDRLKAHGIQNTDVLVQGIDDKLFFPVEKREHQGFFVFSGGKFELRKGQDLVLKAIQILQQKYYDIILVNAWVNFWPQSMYTMSQSPYIRYEYTEGDWESVMNHIYAINGIDPGRVITCEIVPHEDLRELFSKTDIGVFPNRSEGGTNLVLMEYMACGKPVIASNCTGHKDIVDENNSLLLNQLDTREYLDDQGNHFATWDEPSLDELVEKLEYAYLNRKELENIGARAGEHLKKFTWGNMADRLIKVLQKWNYL